ncbi:MAG: family 16 glycosylhydrolase [Bacteroidia bacterium]|nr:family 16 glycosylhydrolase [Bacteroidia bacterium]
MGLFSFLFGGKYPSTKSYENKCIKHEADYKRFLEFEKSQSLARYNELKALLATSDFQAKVNKLKNEKYSDTEASKKESEYNGLASSSDIKSFLYVQKKVEPKLNSALASQNYATYLELQPVVESSEFKEKMAVKGFKKTEDYQVYKRYKKAAKSGEVKYINKVQPSQIYKNYLATKSGDRLKRYYELKEYVSSQEFISFKAEMTDKKRFQKSDEYKLITEFESFSKDKEIVWYNKSKEANAFADVAKWRLTFQDEFDGNALDSNKWTFGYYWGQALSGSVYSLEQEKQAFQKGNVTVSDSEMTILTRKEFVHGTAWGVPSGFQEKDFEFTSAVVNTGASFRQKYGRFDFKVKFNFTKPLTHNIWLAGEKSVPQINVVNFGSLKKNQIETGVVSKNGEKDEILGGTNFSDGYYIISLLWTPEKLVWSVNGVEVHTIRGVIPQEEMYIALSSNLTEGAPKLKESAMTLDWVRVYTWQE